MTMEKTTTNTKTKTSDERQTNLRQSFPAQCSQTSKRTATGVVGQSPKIPKWSTALPTCPGNTGATISIYTFNSFLCALCRYRSLKSSISCARYPAQIPIRCQCRGLENIGTESDPCVSSTRYEGVIEGGNCTCPDQTPQDQIVNGWPIVRLTCCGKRRPTNDVKLVHIPIGD